jgi:upstream activation factor subunit UAF30
MSNQDNKVSTVPTSTNEELNKDQNEVNFKDLMLNLNEQINLQYSNIRLLKNQMKELQRLHKTELKNAIKNSRKNRKNNLKSGFNKPLPVPEKLQKFFSLEEGSLLARTEVTKRIYAYIKENNLQDPNDKRTINPNDELKDLFSLEDGQEVSFYNIQTFIKNLYA